MLSSVVGSSYQTPGKWNVRIGYQPNTLHEKECLLFILEGLAISDILLHSALWRRLISAESRWKVLEAFFIVGLRDEWLT